MGEWWEIRFEDPTDLTAATVQVVQNAFASHRVTGVRVETDAGATDLAVPADGLVALGPVGTPSRLRIRATAVEGTAGEQAGVRDRRARPFPTWSCATSWR